MYRSMLLSSTPTARRSSAFARRKSRAGEWAQGVERERFLPSASMEGLMSLMVTVVEGELLIAWAWCKRRKAMSPVPPAMSRIL